MLLFVLIAVSVVWTGGCVLALALGAMLARADGRAPVKPGRGRRARAQRAVSVGGERMLPTA